MTAESDTTLDVKWQWTAPFFAGRENRIFFCVLFPLCFSVREKQLKIVRRIIFKNKRSILHLNWKQTTREKILKVFWKGLSPWETGVRKVFYCCYCCCCCCCAVKIFCRFSVVTAASIGRGSLKFGGEMQAGRTLLFSSFFFFFLSLSFSCWEKQLRNMRRIIFKNNRSILHLNWQQTTKEKVLKVFWKGLSPWETGVRKVLYCCYHCCGCCCCAVKIL